MNRASTPSRRRGADTLRQRVSVAAPGATLAEVCAAAGGALPDANPAFRQLIATATAPADQDDFDDLLHGLAVELDAWRDIYADAPLESEDAHDAKAGYAAVAELGRALLEVTKPEPAGPELASCSRGVASSFKSPFAYANVSIADDSAFHILAARLGKADIGRAGLVYVPHLIVDGSDVRAVIPQVSRLDGATPSSAIREGLADEMRRLAVVAAFVAAEATGTFAADERLMIGSWLATEPDLRGAAVDLLGEVVGKANPHARPHGDLMLVSVGRIVYAVAVVDESLFFVPLNEEATSHA